MAGRPTMKSIQERVCAKFQITLEAMLSDRRDRQITDPRALAMWLCREAHYTFPQIGRAFNRDHTSILLACRKVDAWKAKEPEPVPERPDLFPGKWNG